MPEKTYLRSFGFRLRQSFFYLYGSVLLGSFCIWLAVNGPQQSGGNSVSWFRQFFPEKMVAHDPMSLRNRDGEWKRIDR